MTDYREYVPLAATPLSFSCIYISVVKFFIIWGAAHMTDTQLWPCDEVGRFLELPDLFTLSSRPPKILYLSSGLRQFPWFLPGLQSNIRTRVVACTGILKAF
jgi:hypothetical protein